KHLVQLHKEGSLDFSRVVTFNLDEYLGLPATHSQSFHYFMREHFFSRVNVNPRNIHIPDGTIHGNYDQYCASFEDDIRKAVRSVSPSLPCHCKLRVRLSPASKPLRSSRNGNTTCEFWR